MNKLLSVLLAVLLVCSCLYGCGSSYSKSEDYVSNGMGYDTAFPEEAPMAPDTEEWVSEESTADNASGETGGGVIAGTGIQVNLSDKIIYTAWADIETTEFENSIDAVYTLLDKFNAFVESSYVSGNSYANEYYGRQSYRDAEIVIRVPRENYAALTSELSVLGNVLSINSSSQNITTQYTDTESRLETYRIEEDRLQDMLEKAETVEDMITIESRLSEIRYYIESLTSTLRDWDNEVNYSTVTVNLREVKKLTEQLPVQRTYWEEIGDGIMSTLRSVGEFFKELFKFIFVSLPVLVILAVIVVVVIVIIVKSRKKRKNRKAAELPELVSKTDDK